MKNLEKLTNIIEAILFASGGGVEIKNFMEKFAVSRSEINDSVDELKQKYPADSGIQLLEFNGKLQLSTNPQYKDEVALVLNAIKEKEFTKTILECASIIAYKQPITRTELESIRGVNSDYAIRTLLELNMIVPCGRKDTIGKPIMYATTDTFLKRFRLTSLDELPDYDALMEKLAKESSENNSSYLYHKDTYSGDDEENSLGDETAVSDGEAKNKGEAEGYDLPDFLKNLSDDEIIKIE